MQTLARSEQELDISELDISELDISELDISESDVSELDISELDISEVDIELDDGSPVEDAEAEVDEPAPLARFGRYEVLGRMAVGGMGEIYLARERSAVGSAREIVIKVLRESLVGSPLLESMFLMEARVALGLSHPSICHVYEVGIEHGRAFIAMEHVQGVTLRALSRRAAARGERLPVPMVAKIGAQIAAALHSAHRARDARRRMLDIVHRDVSPLNVIVGYDGIVKLLDFGVARVRDASPVAEERALIRGKLGYFAPEQCAGAGVDARTDVFSLGVCLWELLTGRRLFKRPDEKSSMHAILNDAAPDPRTLAPVPDALARIVLRALEKRPERRFQSAGELAQALEEYLTVRRELVTAAHIGDLVSRLHAGELAAGPVLERDPAKLAWARSSGRRPSRARRLWPWWLAAALIMSIALLVVLLAPSSLVIFRATTHESGAGAPIPPAALRPAGER